jgi:Uncharacterized conserved protein
MDTLVIDASMGAAGDMLLGALVDVGADPAALTMTEAALEVEYTEARVDRAGIAATRVEVVAASDGSPIEGHGPHRTVADVTQIIEGMELPTAICETAVAIVRRLGTAEAAVHDTTPGEVMFHEVGADDAVADIVGVLQLLDSLGIEQVLSPPWLWGAGVARWPMVGTLFRHRL